MEQRRYEIETNALKNDVNAANDVIAALKKNITQLQEAQKRLSSMWESPAKRELTAAVQTDINQLTQLVDTIRAFINTVSQAREEYDRCENAVGQLVNNIRV